MYLKRLQTELKGLLNEAPPELTLLHNDDNLLRWTIEIHGTPGSLYENEFRFTTNYPLESPEVIFIGPHIPENNHVYSNGHICLSILYDEWSPAMTVQVICLSILSMLSSAQVKTRPVGNADYVARCVKSPKNGHWTFHDDKC